METTHGELLAQSEPLPDISNEDEARVAAESSTLDSELTSSSQKAANLSQDLREVAVRSAIKLSRSQDPTIGSKRLLGDLNRQNNWTLTNKEVRGHLQALKVEAEQQAEQRRQKPPLAQLRSIAGDLYQSIKASKYT